jgi:hypothetical protein
MLPVCTFAAAILSAIVTLYEPEEESKDEEEPR